MLRARDAKLTLRAVLACRALLRDEAARAALARCEQAGLPALWLSEKVYDALRYGERDEGLCAAVSWSPLPLESLRPRANPLLLVLDGIEKPGNLGATLRSAEAAGADALILCDARIDPRNPNVVRASLGTLFTLTVVRCGAKPLRTWLRARSIVAACAIVDAATLYDEVDLRRPLALVLGAEHSGLDARWRDAADIALRLPMHGRGDSLNVSVSAGILLYEAQRQRRRG
jgi:TrmH family RNA methyltransferase